MKPHLIVKSVVVGGPWSPWPRDAWDGTVCWPSVHRKPPEWWAEFWRLTGESGAPTPAPRFLEGYRRDGRLP